MIGFFKKLFGIEDERKTEETKRELYSKVYKRQRAHHVKRMEASPDHFEFHQDMVYHCDRMLGEGTVKMDIPYRDSIIRDINPVVHSESYYRPDTSVSSNSTCSGNSGPSSDSSSSSCSTTAGD
ncbi:MAG: hypothetical protein ACRC6V_12175 [Bacteroidales bacterium]